MASMDYQGRLLTLAKEALPLIPFAKSILHLFLPPSSLYLKQTLSIPIAQDINNSQLNLQQITLQLHNKNLQFKSAHLQFESQLKFWSIFGFRAVMRRYFYTVAFLVVGALTFINTVWSLVGVFLVYRVFLGSNSSKRVEKKKRE